eukprot:GDKI01035444.1.p1 GENE.GDKI01035444.1~~GDKI01035444.1.p1  ORF type:complete len:370 (-),score=115.02 GDKI01035444.1:55-1164(-)
MQWMKNVGTNIASVAQDGLKHVEKAVAKKEEPKKARAAPKVPFGSGTRKSVLIGINYFGQKPGELRGCHNDVETIKRFITKQGFPSNPQQQKVLLDGKGDPTTEPTRDNIIAAMKWLVSGAKAGDVLYMHYSGHGGSLKDDNGDEADGRDETMVPVDYKEKGQIRDDLIYDILVRALPAGVRLTVIFDCCHSGTLMDLPYVFKANEANCKNWYEGIPAMIMNRKWDVRDLKGMGNEALDMFKDIYGAFQNRNEGKDKKPGELGFQRETRMEALADVVMFSGCMDKQTSADVRDTGKHFVLPADAGPGGAGGALTNSLIQTLSTKGDIQFIELLDSMRKILGEKNFTQVPQLSCSKEMKLDRKFDLVHEL